MSTFKDNDVKLNDLGKDPGQVGPDSGGQSGDTQGLSPIADAAEESVEELADSGQSYESEVVEGVEDVRIPVIVIAQSGHRDRRFLAS